MMSNSLHHRKWEERRHLIGGMILLSLLFFGYYLPVCATMLLMIAVAWMALISFVGWTRTTSLFLISFLIPMIILSIRNIWGIDMLPWGESIEIALQASALCMMVYGAIVWVLKILRSKRAGFDEVIGACNLYVWIATIYACFYTFISRMNPSAFHLQDLQTQLAKGLNATPFKQTFNELYYFSFVTQTTLGYGDIVPFSHPARAFAISQAIIGQFYVAVVLTYILNLWIRDLAHQPDKKITQSENLSAVHDEQTRID